jgi:hypothetical protein
MVDEREAKDLLTKTWSQYSRAHKTECVGMTSKGGQSSYVELISCLDIMKDAAALYKRIRSLVILERIQRRIRRINGQTNVRCPRRRRRDCPEVAHIHRKKRFAKRTPGRGSKSLRCGERTSGGSKDVVLCPDGATVIDRRFGCCNLLQRGVIHRGTRKASHLSLM